MFEIISPRCAFLYKRVSKKDLADLKRWVAFQKSENVVDSVLFIDSIGGCIDEELLDMFLGFPYSAIIMGKANSTASILALMASVIYAAPGAYMVVHSVIPDQEDLDGSSAKIITKKVQTIFSKVLPRTSIRYEFFSALHPNADGLNMGAEELEAEEVIDLVDIMDPKDLDLTGEFLEKYTETYEEIHKGD